MTWWEAFPAGMVFGWTLIVGLLVWAGRNKDRILAWYIRRSMTSDPERWRPAPRRDLP